MSPWFYIVGSIVIILQTILIVGSAKMMRWEKAQMQTACGTLFVSEGESGRPDLYLEVEDLDSLMSSNITTFRVVKSQSRN